MGRVLANQMCCKGVPQWLKGSRMQAPHARRDLLLDIQWRAQQKWAEHKVFESDAPHDGEAAAHIAYLMRNAARAPPPASPGIDMHVPGTQQLPVLRPLGVVKQRVVHRSIVASVHRSGVIRGEQVLWDVPVPVYERPAAFGPRLFAVQGTDAVQ